MSKRRTRKQKERLHYKWSLPEALVKRELKNNNMKDRAEADGQKRADLLAKEIDVPTIRKDIVRSLLVTSFILASELVIYLTWNN